MKSKNIVILVVGIVLGIIVMPIVALISFGIVTTVANQMTGTPNLITTTPCTGKDNTGGENNGVGFIGFIEVDNSNACVMLNEKQDGIVYRDSDIRNDTNVIVKPTEIKTSNTSQDGAISITDLVVNLFRILLYCSICLIPVLPVGAVIWFLVQNKKQKDQSTK